MWQLQSEHFIWAAIKLRLLSVAVTVESKGGTSTYCGITLKHLRHSLKKTTIILH